MQKLDRHAAAAGLYSWMRPPRKLGLAARASVASPQVGVSRARTREVEAFLDRAAGWAATRNDLLAAALVGSWARGSPQDDSDVDLLLLTTDPDVYTQHEEWVCGLAPGADLIRTQDWKAITERRLALSSGLEIEVGVGVPSWASTDPVDPGTRRVVGAGLRPLYDPTELLAALIDACR